MYILGRLFKFDEAQVRRPARCPQGLFSASMGEPESNLADAVAGQQDAAFFNGSRFAPGCAPRQRRSVCSQLTGIR